MDLKFIKDSYINVSGNVYDSDYINLALIENGTLSFGKDTLFLTEKEKQELNEQKIVNFQDVIYVVKYRGSYGLIANLDIEDYRINKIKCHELVLPDVVQGMIANYHIYNSETAPVCIIHKDKIDLKTFVIENEYSKKYFFDEVEIFVYSTEVGKKLLDSYKYIENMYVADGHHRLYSTSLMGQKNDVMCCFYSFDEVEILPIHRLLKNVSEEEFKNVRDFICGFFEVSNEEKTLENGYVKMIRNEDSYFIKLNDVSGDSFWNNDVYRLNTQVITTAFRIFDPSKIEYIFESDLPNLKKNLKKTDVLLELQSLKKEDFMELSSKNCILPPKSTCFVPKFPSFLIFKKYK